MAEGLGVLDQTRSSRLAQVRPLLDQLERPWVRRKVEVGAWIGERRGEVPTKGNERDFQCRRWPLVLGQLDMIGVHQVRHRYVRTSSLPELGDGIVES